MASLYQSTVLEWLSFVLEISFLFLQGWDLNSATESQAPPLLILNFLSFSMDGMNMGLDTERQVLLSPTHRPSSMFFISE